MSDRVWFLNTAEGQAGPYTADELRQWKAAGQITDEWYVWREGLAGWQTVGATAELGAAPAPAPPPAPPPAPVKVVAPQPAPEPQPVATTVQSTAPAEPKKKKGLPRAVVLGLIVSGILLLLIAGAGAFLWYSAPETLDPILIPLGLKKETPPPAPPLDLAPPKTRAQFDAEREAKKLLRGLSEATSLAQVFSSLSEPLAARTARELLAAADVGASESDSAAVKKAGANFFRTYAVDLAKDSDATALWTRLSDRRDSFIADLDVLLERTAPDARGWKEFDLDKAEFDATDATTVRVTIDGKTLEIRNTGGVWRVHEAGPSEANETPEANRETRTDTGR